MKQHLDNEDVELILGKLSSIKRVLTDIDLYRYDTVHGYKKISTNRHIVSYLSLMFAELNRIIE